MTDAVLKPVLGSESMDERLAACLAEGLSAMGIDLEGFRQQRMLAFVALLDRWNKTYNLTAVRDPATMVERHLLDSISVLSLVNACAGDRPTAHLVDVGTGPGLPGIPLAIACDSLRCTLVETNGKKVAFLRHCMATLELGSVSVVHGRIENTTVAQLAHGPVDLIIARAFSSVEHLLATTKALIAPTTTLIAMKGPNLDDELRELTAAQNDRPSSTRDWRATHTVRTERLHLPGNDAMRYAIVVSPSREASLS